MIEFIENYGFLIILFPLLGAITNGIFSRLFPEKLRDEYVAWIACTSVFLSFLLAVAAFIQINDRPDKALINTAYTWIQAGNLKVSMSFLFDQLSVVMILIVTGLGLIIHIYSVEYMRGDSGYPRYFSYLNLFISAMLLLVLADNALIMFIGWEGVGICSYLLIGFWYDDSKNAIAGNKAFIVNRVGDFGFILGLFILFWNIFEVSLAGNFEAGAELLNFEFIKSHATALIDKSFLGVNVLTLAGILLFFGATGKSAQMPLHVWLPDAMAGPTPVSALIHAATMVTAGIYMIGRFNFLFAMSDVALTVIAYTGAVTAFLAATMGCVQNDIKKILAYSTISQLGYMFMAMGVTAFSAGIFHLLTHAFFKACLFLCAGSVIIGMHHEQDIRLMGGLRKKMPITFLAFSIAALSIAGVPPFAGFFSKDQILWNVLSSSYGSKTLFIVGLLTAGLTAFYMSRMFILIFLGDTRITENNNHFTALNEIKESPSLIILPLLILAFFSAATGFLNMPEIFGGGTWLDNFFAPVFGNTANHENEYNHDKEFLMMSASVGIIFAGVLLALLVYRLKPLLVKRFTARFHFMHVLVLRKYFIDEIYDYLFVSVVIFFAKLASFFDRYVIDVIVNLFAYLLRIKSFLIDIADSLWVDGAVNFVADKTLFLGKKARSLQSGRIQVYLVVMALALMVAMAYKLIMWRF